MQNIFWEDCAMWLQIKQRFALNVFNGSCYLSVWSKCYPDHAYGTRYDVRIRNDKRLGAEGKIAPPKKARVANCRSALQWIKPGGTRSGHHTPGIFNPLFMVLVTTISNLDRVTKSKIVTAACCHVTKRTSWMRKISK